MDNETHGIAIMSIHPLTHATAEGPLGFPVTDRQAFALEAILKALPREDAFRYRKTLIAKGASEILPGERSDVSWISTEDPDRTGEVVAARGMNDGQFKLNPIVTMQHAYWLPPVGRSLWRKVVRDGGRHGVKAKTQYPSRPADWPAEKDWPADVALALVQADLLRGKSIGFLPTKVHTPKAKELEEQGWDKVELVIDEWILLEYACTFLPAQQNAVVEAVGKSLVQLPEEFIKAMGLDPNLFQQPAAASLSTQAPPRLDRYTPLEEIEKSLCRRLAALDLAALAEKAAVEALDSARGRI
jgi:hypothetical protein